MPPRPRVPPPPQGGGEARRPVPEPELVPSEISLRIAATCTVLSGKAND